VRALLTLLLFAAPAYAAPVSDFTAELVARSFVRSLLEGRPQSALPLCGAEVNLDGRKLRDRTELLQALEAVSARARRRGLRLRQLVVLEAAEAVRRFGQPPRRLRGSVVPGSLVVLARLNHLGAAVLLRREGGFWRVTGLTD
jgi:hypothetical protein